MRILKHVFQATCLLSLFASCVMAAPSAVADSATFTLKSSDIREGQVLSLAQVFNGFGCKGENISPQLSWSNAPSDTKSFAITVYDPDAPTGSGWWHWTVFNLPANLNELARGAGSGQGLPVGALQGRTDYGKPGFGGACPPVGDKPHRYIFTVYALKLGNIDLDDQASGALVGYYLNQNSLAKASITAFYGR